MIVVIPARLQMAILINGSFWNWNKSRKKGIFKMSARKKIAPPATHNTARLGVAKILKILSVHDLLVNITAMFETIKVINAIARTSFAS